MKKVILLFAAVSAIALLTACGTDKKKTASSSVTETETTSLTTGAETTLTTTSLTSTTTSVTTTSSATTTTTATTTEISATTSDTRTFTHSVEIKNTDFRTFPVPDEVNRIYLSDRDFLSEPAIRAIEEDREIYASLITASAEEDSDHVYVCVYYIEEATRCAIYRIDESTGEVSFCGDSSGFWSDGLSHFGANIHGLLVVGGRPVLSTYGGLFTADEETQSFVAIDKSWEPLGGGAYVYEDKLYAYEPQYNEETKNYDVKHHVIFNSTENTITQVDKAPEGVEMIPIGDLLMEKHNRVRVTSEGEKGGEQKYLIEWN